MQQASAGDRRRGGQLDFLTRLDEAIDALICERQPPVWKRGVRQIANRFLQRALGVGVPARRAEHARERQPGTLVPRRSADSRSQFSDALVVLRLRPVDEPEDTMGFRLLRELGGLLDERRGLAEPSLSERANGAHQRRGTPCQIRNERVTVCGFAEFDDRPLVLADQRCGGRPGCIPRAEGAAGRRQTVGAARDG